MKYDPKHVAQIQRKQASLKESLHRNPLANYTHGWFFVTLNTRDNVPILSQCVGSPYIPDGNPGAPICKYTELGKMIKEVWERNEQIYTGVVVDVCEVMPEHFHGLIYLKPDNEQHLGRIINGFMIGCTHAYWDVLGIDWKSKTYVKGQKSPEWQDKDHTYSKRGPALFVRGYNDVEVLTEEQVQIKRRYIQDQARKRLLQGENHNCFKIYRNAHSQNWTFEVVKKAIAEDRYIGRNPVICSQLQMKVLEHLLENISLDYLGNKELMASNKKLPLVCHRSDQMHIDVQNRVVMEAARNGSIIVSAFISPNERDIRNQLLAERLPFIEIMNNGFSERYKPIGKAFYACAENRLVQISCWKYQYQRDSKVSREMCLVMNQLVRVICGMDDDWWKAEV